MPVYLPYRMHRCSDIKSVGSYVCNLSHDVFDISTIFCIMAGSAKTGKTTGQVASCYAALEDGQSIRVTVLVESTHACVTLPFTQKLSLLVVLIVPAIPLPIQLPCSSYTESRVQLSPRQTYTSSNRCERTLMETSQVFDDQSYLKSAILQVKRDMLV